ncbi:small ribosomal subunit protein uS12-like [Zophobas morio]|uniref:small ribosomal subunit protein uS12-like n=1 Tax=Zophobas morio TaxID=2755281 RepID=UPI003082BE45
MTLLQCIRRKKYRKIKVSKCKALQGCPFKSGVVLKLMIMKPKKPNSANRRVAKVRLSNGFIINAFINGGKHNLSPHSSVLVRGGGRKDLPGVNYSLVRGNRDLGGADRVHARSKYGAKKSDKGETKKNYSTFTSFLLAAADLHLLKLQVRMFNTASELMITSRLI